MAVSGIDANGFPIVKRTTNADALDPGEQKEMFLKMLVAQLQNQDPMNPMEDKEFLGQMAQFSAVEQMSNVSKTLESMQTSSMLAQGVSLIGKRVEYVDGDALASGVVESVQMADGTARLRLAEGGLVEVGAVRSVS